MYAKVEDWKSGSFQIYLVEITSFKAKMLKKADINNLDDYYQRKTFYPYIYEIEISGKVPLEYVNTTGSIMISIVFPQGSALVFYGDQATFNSDGSFACTARAGSYNVEDTIFIASLFSYYSTVSDHGSDNPLTWDEMV